MDDARQGARADSVPSSLWIITALALAPFVTAALAFDYGPAAYASPAMTVLLSWSAAVLSFLGGVRWGLESAEAAPRRHRLALSVLAPTFAWAICLWRHRMDEAHVIIAFMAIFLAQWLLDHQSPDTPARYPKLSTVLTAGACISLGLVLEKIIAA
jgi:hypothetical protein